MITLNSPISALPRIGVTISALFSKIGIETAGDLLFYLPFRYNDFSNHSLISELKSGQVAQISGTIDLIQNKRSFRHKLNITEALIQDGSGYLKLVWFNQPFLTKNMKVGDKISVAGRVGEDYGQLKMVSPEYEKASSSIHTSGLIPNYHTTDKLSQKQIRRAVAEVLPLAGKVKDWLPEGLRLKLGLASLPSALEKIHFPKDKAEAVAARQRLAFTELFLRQLKSQTIRQYLDTVAAPAIPFDEQATKSFVSGLPFKLTPGQRQASWEILQDISRTRPMSRLLEGDVGSGKTLVAAIALFNTALSGQQGAVMVPTELLATQHFNSLNQLFSVYDIKIALVCSKKKEYNFIPVKKKEAWKEADIIIGTHALIQKGMDLPRLALAIVDEQHRFGVKQRQQIMKAESGLLPHFLSMTAIPIPRSLTLAIYGDLDLSIIPDKPAGRKEIVTKLVKDSQRQEMYSFMRDKLKGGQQLFVVCPLIDESDKLGAKSAKKEGEKLQKEVFLEYRVGILHGKMKKEEQEKVMASFLAKDIDVLVATSIIEVGIDVPNATMMLIEGAERFGLAQLHQFRGRIGRGEQESYCFVCPSQEELSNPKTIERLEALARYQDGHKLAQVDLDLRGAGDIYGTLQSGFDELQIGALFDSALIKRAGEEAAAIIRSDPSLEKHPVIRQKLADWETRLHLE